MESSKSADEIRQQMQLARRRMRVEVDEVVSGARQMANWKYYVRHFPWASLGAAAALGFAAIPRRLEILSPDVDTLLKLAKNNQLVVDPKPEGTRKPGFVDSLMTMAGNVLLRAGIAYAGQNMGKILGHAAAEPAPEEAHRP